MPKGWVNSYTLTLWNVRLSSCLNTALSAIKWCCLKVFCRKLELRQRIYSKYHQFDSLTSNSSSEKKHILALLLSNLVLCRWESLRKLISWNKQKKAQFLNILLISFQFFFFFLGVWFCPFTAWLWALPCPVWAPLVQRHRMSSGRSNGRVCRKSLRRAPL